MPSRWPQAPIRADWVGIGYDTPEEKVQGVTRDLTRSAFPLLPMPRVRFAHASWYGPGFYGNLTANGTLYTQSTLCVAHKTLPFGTMIQIWYSGKTITVPVLDRGPFIPGRDFDLSGAVASALGFSGVGTIKWSIIE